MKNNHRIYKDVLANSNITTGDEYRQIICAVSQVATDMVAKTLGPYGSTTIIDDGLGFTYPTKDGWTCLNKLQFTDSTYTSIFQTLKNISFDTVLAVGDGTTTAMVVANAFINAITNEDGSIDIERQADYINSIQQISNIVIRELKNNSRIKTIDIEDPYADIYNIAHISTNGHHEYAHMIADIYSKTKSPHIHVETGLNPKTYSEINEGYKFNTRVLNYQAYINDSSQRGGVIKHIDSPRDVFVFNHNVTYQGHAELIAVLGDIANKRNTEIVLFAPNFDNIIASFIDSSVKQMMKENQYPNVMLVQMPNAFENHRLVFNDLSVLTNARIFDEAHVKAFNVLMHKIKNPDAPVDDQILTMEGMVFKSPADVIEVCKGRVNSITIDKSQSFIQDYEHIVNERQYNNLLSDAKERYEAEYEKRTGLGIGSLSKDLMQAHSRYLKLHSKTGVIKVGGASEIQIHTDKDALDDAVLACKAAFENGYVRGLNLEVLTIINNMLTELGMSDETFNEHYDYIFDLPYAKDILQLLYDSFMTASMRVLGNRYEGVAKYNVEINVATSDNTDDARSDSNEIMMNSELMNYLIQSNNLDYNMITSTISDKWSVVNPSITDIEILKSVVNTLVTIITSNQFISTTRRFDERSSLAKSLSTRLEAEYEVTKAKLRAIKEEGSDVDISL